MAKLCECALRVVSKIASKATDNQNGIFATRELAPTPSPFNWNAQRECRTDFKATNEECLAKSKL